MDPSIICPPEVWIYTHQAGNNVIMIGWHHSYLLGLFQDFLKLNKYQDVFMSVCLFVWYCIYLIVCKSVCLFVNIFVCLFVRLFICIDYLFVSLSFFTFDCIFVYNTLCPSVFSVCLSVFSVCFFVCLYVCLFFLSGC